MGDLVDYVIGFVGAAIVIVLVGVLGFAMYDMWNQSRTPTFELYKNQWTCTKEVVESSFTPIFNGKSTTMVPTTKNVCVQWNRNHE